MSTLKAEEIAALSIVALKLGVDANDLYKLIDFESSWNPKAKNKLSTSKGLIQFTDSTAQSLGFKNSQQLIDSYPTVTTQLDVVERYLSQFKPFKNKQALYMSVFFPSARNWNPYTSFSDAIQAVNPGIKTPADYIKMVEGGSNATSVLMVSAIAALGIFFLINKKLR